VCGRMTIGKEDPQDVAAVVAAKLDPTLASEWKPRFNVAPTQRHPVLVLEGGERWLRGWKWGMRRANDKRLHINAKAETAKHLPAFREAFASRRCVAVADGFYEWVTTDEGKHPVWFHRPDGGLILVAGLWEPSLEAGGPPTFTVLTTTPNDLVAPVHNRMPALLPLDLVDAWLTGEATRVPGPAPEDYLAARHVSPRANSFKNDDPACLEAQVPPTQPTP
jgi:putative SOS response-associated peptidase YedK